MALRVLLVGLEFADPLFSGNGTYARCVARMVLAAGHSLLVVCGAKEGAAAARVRQALGGKVSVECVAAPVPVWYRVDRHSGWAALRDACERSEVVRERVREFAPDVVCGVDWTGCVAARALGLDAPLLYLNFRVFHASSNLAAEDAAFYREREREALIAARVSIALCRDDAALLQRAAGEAAAAAAAAASSPPVAVLHPPLRDEMVALALGHEGSGPSGNEEMWQRRDALLCCCRWSPEKNVLAFVELAATLRGFLRQHGVRIVLCGAHADKEYAAAIRARLSASFERVSWAQGDAAEADAEVIVRDFVPPPLFAATLGRALLNFHSPLYEPYALTIMEAAAFGTPSVVHCSGVGALDRLSADTAFPVDLSDVAATATLVRALLAPPRTRLRQVGAAARAAALAYQERDAAEALDALVRQAVKAKQ